MICAPVPIRPRFMGEGQKDGCWTLGMNALENSNAITLAIQLQES